MAAGVLQSVKKACHCEPVHTLARQFVPGAAEPPFVGADDSVRPQKARNTE